MHKISVLLLFSLILMSFAANAFMPSYDDDEEFKRCNRVTGDSTICVKEQAQRVLNIVKRQYRTILTDSKTLPWTGSAQTNTQTLKDMYESWTAFRNRLCSLSNKATMYLEPLYDAKEACNLYYILHHEDHLNSIILLLQGKATQYITDFDFLKIYDHDDEYEKCIADENKNYSICIDEELVRSTKDIKNHYKTLSEDELVGKWNNGDGLKSGNYRDMFDSWVAYRNRMCSLAVWAYQNTYGPDAIRLNDCIQFYNREKLETLQNLLVSAHSSLDVFPGDEGIEDDGGLAEGQTVVPLKRHINSGLNNADEMLIEEKEIVPAEQPLKEQLQPKPQTRKIPSWAKNN